MASTTYSPSARTAGRAAKASTLISATGNLKRSSAGFTIVEVLVVVFILGLLASMVVLSLPSTTDDPAKQVRAMAARLELAGQEAILSGLPLGVELGDDAIQFYSYAGGTWVGVDGNAAFAPLSIPEGVTVQRIAQEGRPPPRPDSVVSLEPVPELRFYPTGEATESELSVSTPGAVYRISIAPNGDVELERADGS